jgi:hypothetical protein
LFAVDNFLFLYNTTFYCTELVIEGNRNIVEEGTNTDEVMEDGEESDSWAYGSDDDDDDMMEEKESSVLEALMKNSDKKPVTPRQHFKCSQCNKIFYGPLKFKSKLFNQI